MQFCCRYDHCPLKAPSVIPHCIFNSSALSALFQTFSGFSLKMTSARVPLATETSYLSRGQAAKYASYLFWVSDPVHKGHFPLLIRVMPIRQLLHLSYGISLYIWKIKAFKVLPKGEKKNHQTLNTEHRLNSLTRVQRKEAEPRPRKTEISLKTSCSMTQHYIHAPCSAIIY